MIVAGFECAVCKSCEILIRSSESFAFQHRFLLNERMQDFNDLDQQQNQSLREKRSALTEVMQRLLPSDALREVIDGVWLRRVSAPTELSSGSSHPSFCIIAQGSKEIWLGDTCLRYDPDRYLISTAALPVSTRITEASVEAPFLNLVMRLDPAIVSSVMVEAGRLATRGQVTASALDVSALEPDLLDASVRLVRLAEAPADDARILAPLIKREIVYRLLIGQQGERLRHLTTIGGPEQPISRAIDRLRKDFDRPVRIEELARDIGMSPSSFHQHFRQVTAMSPLQFQKQLRLQEARRLMLGEQLDATSAAFRVGYDDAAHFSREYKRLFGAPPMRDVQRLRGSAIESAAM